MEIECFLPDLRYFDSQLEVPELEEPKRKQKIPQAAKEKSRIVTALKWTIKENDDINARSGVYFLRTSLEAYTEEIV